MVFEVNLFFLGGLHINMVSNNLGTSGKLIMTLEKLQFMLCYITLWVFELKFYHMEATEAK